MEGISIIICCYNSGLRLPETLKHIAILDGLDAISAELIIVDNASSDDTAAIAAKEIAKSEYFSGNHKIVHEGKPGLSWARKKGISEAKYDYILFCDDDNWLDNNYLKVSMRLMAQYPKAGVLGGVGTPCFESGEKPDWFDEHQGVYAIGKQADQDGVIPAERSYVYGAGSVWQKKALNEIIASPLLVTGRLKNKLTSSDDNELCYKAIALGYEVIFSSDLKFIHFIPASRLSLDYVKRIQEDSAPGSLLLHGLMYKIGVHQNMFNTYPKRTWWGQVIAILKRFFSANTPPRKVSVLMLKQLLVLNWKYNRLFK